MNEPNSNQIHRSITRFRRITIGTAVFIALLSTAMILHTTSVLDDTTATKINLAGKQRMLAQRTLTNALAIDTAARTGEWDELEPNLKELKQTIDDLKESHTILLTDHSSAHQEAYRAIEVPYITLVKSTTELQRLTISMIRRSPYIDDQTFKRVTAAKDEITQAHGAYVPGMNAITDLYEQEYKSRIRSSIVNARIGMAILFIVLIAVILFVVEPTILIIRRQLRDLDTATRQAKRADAVRWRLLTNMGHEFRTPMNAIMGFASLMCEESLSESERSRLAKSIYESSTHLTHLIETMLDMSAIESGQLRVMAARCNPVEILTKIKIDASAKALSKGLDINLEIDESCPKLITSDPKRFEQILYNLVENAIKYTPAGSIAVQVRLIENQTKKTLEIKVIDTGIGIKPEDQQTIFDPFRQAEDNITRDFGGAGLGLSISRDLARALGGDVAVESTVGQGSTFTLTINPGKIKTQATPTPPQSQVPIPTTLDSYKILVVDDAKDNRILLQHIFKPTGAAVEFAHDGQQAIDAVNAAIEDSVPYDLIIMDMQMPVLDGYHATVELRNQGITTPIIALTAHALDSDREHCLEAGCDEYMSKPVNKEILIQTCARMIQEQPSRAIKAA